MTKAKTTERVTDEQLQIAEDARKEALEIRTEHLDVTASDDVLVNKLGNVEAARIEKGDPTLDTLDARASAELTEKHRTPFDERYKELEDKWKNDPDWIQRKKEQGIA